MLERMVGDAATIKPPLKVNSTRLPPSRCSLIPHIKRADHRAGQWKHAHENLPEIPLHTDDHSWAVDDDYCQLEPVWYNGPVSGGS